MRRSHFVAALAALVACSEAVCAFAQAAAGASGPGARPTARPATSKAMGPPFQATQAREARTRAARTATRTWAITSKAQTSGDANGPVPSLKKLTAKQLNTTCLECHEKANQANYRSSMHDAPQRGLHRVPQHPRATSRPRRS